MNCDPPKQEQEHKPEPQPHRNNKRHQGKTTLGPTDTTANRHHRQPTPPPTTIRKNRKNKEISGGVAKLTGE